MTTGCIGWKTLWQGLAMGLIGGPIMWCLRGGEVNFFWGCFAMFLAPFIVDAIRPVRYI